MYSKSARSTEHSTKKGFFSRWFEKKIRNTIKEIELEDQMIKLPRFNNLADSEERLGSNRKITFTVHNATGGLIVETDQYDDRTDRYNRSLYIIGSDQDIGSEISKIITMESLKS